MNMELMKALDLMDLMDEKDLPKRVPKRVRAVLRQALSETADREDALRLAVGRIKSDPALYDEVTDFLLRRAIDEAINPTT